MYGSDILRGISKVPFEIPYKISDPYIERYNFLSMYGSDVLRGISKVPFEIPHKISDPYMERYDFYTTSKFSELLDLRAHTRKHTHTSVNWVIFAAGNVLRPIEYQTITWQNNDSNELV